MNHQPGITASERLWNALRARNGQEPTACCGEWPATCPLHDDADLSLHIAVDSDGQVLLRCQQGCKTIDIMAALKLQTSDLEPATIATDIEIPAPETAVAGLDIGVSGVTPTNFLSPADCRPFPLEALPPRIREFVSTSAAAMGCPIEFLAVPMLPVLASAIGNSRRLQVKGAFTVPPIIWTVIIGEPGTLKSPAFRVILRPVWDAQSQSLQKYKRQLLLHQARMREYVREMRLWNKRPSGAPPVKPAEPEMTRVVVADTTMQALAPILATNPRGVLSSAEELDGWLRSFSRFGGNDLPLWLQLFDGSALVVDRKTGPDRILSIPMAAASIVGTTQPGALRRALGARERECGLAGRLLFAMPRREPKRWTEAAILPECEAQYALIIERLRDLELQVLDGTPEPLIVRMDSAAKQLWIQFFNEHAQELAQLTGDLAAVWSKIEGYAARLALVVHLTRWAEEDATIQDVDWLDQTSMRAGIELARWFATEARRVYAMLDGKDVTHNADSNLLGWIQGRGGVVTIRDLTHNLREFRGSPEGARAALNKLRDSGLGLWTNPAPNREGGRPREEFHLTEAETAAKPGDTM